MFTICAEDCYVQKAALDRCTGLSQMDPTGSGDRQGQSSADMQKLGSCSTTISHYITRSEHSKTAQSGKSTVDHGY